MTQRTVLRIVPAIALVALASCGASKHESAQGEAAVENAALTKLQLTSDAFRDGQPIPSQYTCDGAGQTPTLHWGEPPKDTKSFALVIDDPEAPSGIFRHWGVFDIPPSARSIGGNERIGTEVSNDFGRPGYGGPCPPKGNGPHHYHFKLFALDVGSLGLNANSHVSDVEREAQKHVVASGELIGTYERR
ncbi:MAG TPA: YbhB/YbcL family Raf kinase inhibitor-like protein [Sphingomicrobium sp.]|jgi:hypothetical protein|nr:YbhB/YbcL family Raf kinase inhibitor-like protein [Sphingomicrobium sp.]